MNLINLTNFKMINLFDNEYYNECQVNVQLWEENHGNYYESILCCKNINKNSKKTIDSSFNNISPFITNEKHEIYNNILDNKCVLIKNHEGNCCKTVNIFKNLTGQIKKVVLSIYSTPGNDDYIFKNRHDRLFPIMLSSFDEFKIKDTKKKLKCAIPLKDASTPLMLVGAYFDYITFLLNVKGVRESHTIKSDYLKILDSHKEKLIKYFNGFGKKIFNNLGFTICPVTGREITLNDLTGDTRRNPKKTDIQIGHCEPRNDKMFTIRGFNICMMTRDGNSKVGDCSFFDDEWVENLDSIVKFQRLTIS